MTVIFFNGQFFGQAQPGGGLEQAKLGVLDAGVQHGVGVFETMLGGVIARGIETDRSQGEETETWCLQLDEHLERLEASARALGLSEQLRLAALAETVLETIRRTGLPRARVRLTVTGGDLNMLTAARAVAAGQSPRPADPGVMIVAQPATDYPAEMYQRGVGVVLADTRANPLNPHEGHKTLNYWWRLRELRAAGMKGAAEGLVLSVTNHVCGGCVSNIALVNADRLITPLARGETASDGANPQDDRAESAAPSAEELGMSGFGPGGARSSSGKHSPPRLPSPVLPGITRDWLMNKAERLGLRVERRWISVQDVLDADEVMLTNSSWGVLPVVTLEASPIRGGQVGPFSADLAQAWRELIPQDSAEQA